jgi:SAM-dependent methyltransferase
MTHVSSGVHSILNRSLVYRCYSALIGAGAAYTRYVEEFVRPSAHSRILDIGCGPGTILEYLPATVDYVGYDFNPNYIEHAKRIYRGRGQFVCSRVSDAPLGAGRQFDIVLATGILHHLDETEADQLFKSARGQTKRGGRLVTYDPVILPHQRRAARFLMSWDRGRNMRTLEGYRTLASRHFRSVKSAVISDALRIPYDQCVMVCSE